MSTSLATLIRLRGIQNKTRELFEGMNDIQYRLQYHHDLSPAGWHLGHGMFIENYWLHEVIQGDSQYTSDTSLFIPQNCPKPERGPRLPPLQNQLRQIHEQQDNNDIFLLEKTPPLSNHPLFKDEYIENFIIQHYAQHYETIYMVLNQIALKKFNPGNNKNSYIPSTLLEAQAPGRDIVHINQGEYSIGGEWPFSYDNELPPHMIHLDDYYISRSPVTNSEYLTFINDNGYLNKELWCEEGWQWRDDNKILHPEHWRQNEKQQWYGIKHQGPCDLQNNDFVYGISHYEACAFAKWSNSRLPHEHEWETAVRLGQLKHNSKVWEWCNNQFFPYEGFKAFPYDEYSTPWFDVEHYVLKGASQYTRPEIKRASFRNFYQPHQRHIFAGLRLVFQ